MDLVELQPLAQALVGRPGSSGLSVEQRKRLTIAVELVRAAYMHSGGSRALPSLSNQARVHKWLLAAVWPCTADELPLEVASRGLHVAEQWCCRT